jgi:WD40 repeat protein
MTCVSNHSNGVYSVAWSAGGDWLATASDDGTVQFCEMDIQNLMNLARQGVTAFPSVEGCKTYLQVDKARPSPSLPRACFKNTS